jgi:hypothetical protein
MNGMAILHQLVAWESTVVPNLSSTLLQRLWHHSTYGIFCILWYICVQAIAASGPVLRVLQQQQGLE